MKCVKIKSTIAHSTKLNVRPEISTQCSCIHITLRGESEKHWSNNFDTLFSCTKKKNKAEICPSFEHTLACRMQVLHAMTVVVHRFICLSFSGCMCDWSLHFELSNQIVLSLSLTLILSLCLCVFVSHTCIHKTDADTQKPREKDRKRSRHCLISQIIERFESLHCTHYWLKPKFSCFYFKTI